VSRVLTTLGVMNRAHGFIGGFTGEELEGRMLNQGLPDVIKPNIHELGRLVGSEVNEMDEILSAEGTVREQGVNIVLVSMGARRILLVSEKEQYLASPPKVKVENTIGAGDSAVAGFVSAWAEGKSFKEALICAVPAGTATTLRPGTALCQKEDFH
jgi:6-phosphofructokinase 2